MNFDTRLKISLLALRVGVFIVMIMWTIDKFVNPAHASKVFAKFYFIPGLSHTIAFAIGAAQLILVLAFLFGIKKRWSYGIVLILHAVSTFSSYMMYLDPWGPRNLLFFAAWPMLAAIFALYMLRDKDSFLTLS